MVTKFGVNMFKFDGISFGDRGVMSEEYATEVCALAVVLLVGWLVGWLVGCCCFFLRFVSGMVKMMGGQGLGGGFSDWDLR